MKQLRLKRLLLPILIATVLVACSAGEVTEKELSKEDLKALVHEYSVGEFTDESATITAHELIIADVDGNETIYDLPDDEFFVSIAPYINETHP